MRDQQTENATEIKFRQYRNLAMVAAAVIIILVILYMIMQSKEQKKSDEKMDASAFSSPIENVNTQSIWVERAQNQLKEQQRQTDELKKQITDMKDNTKKSPDSDPVYQELKEQNELLKKSLEEKNVPENAAISGSSQYKGNVFSGAPGADPFQSQPDLVNSGEAAGIDIDELELKPINKGMPIKTADTFVPSGTFTEAIMLGAADASAGVTNLEAPSPMLFRITADGTLPNHQKSHLKDCVVTAAVVGDISSERGQIRLERMSCTFPNGEIVEQPVQGTVFGMDAKNGVRGTPVWREGSLLARAAIAGTLSGIGSGISQSYTTNAISPLGTTQTVSGGDIFKYGASQGAATAMNKLADYNIRRAELYHPVIQLTAGQPVDVVFLCGFFLDGRKHDSCKSETNEDAREPGNLFSPTVKSSETSTGLTLSESQMQKIKQNEQAMGWSNQQ